MAEAARLAEPFRQASQQRDARLMGMYLFLATEIMLFGGLFAAIFVVRLMHPAEFVEASRELRTWLGAINTAVLLTSSLAVALAVGAARNGRRGRTALLLSTAALIGLAFLAIKGFEYSEEIKQGLLPVLSEPTEFKDPVHHLFMNLYLVSTSLHGVHVTIGTLLLGCLALRIGLNWLRLPEGATSVEVVGLFWHLVDVIWVFLYPALYLAR